MMAITSLLCLLGICALTCATPWPPQPTLPPWLPGSPGLGWVNYTAVPGFFLQDDANTDPSTFDYTTSNFGLINRTYPTDNRHDSSLSQWQRFEHYVTQLNLLSGRRTSYKLLYMGRHGEGYHNAAETYYGTPAWNCYWSVRDGNSTAVWADARIDDAGIAQARAAAAFWASRIAHQRIPLPQTYYTSPLTRCLETARLTFAGLPLPLERPFVPVVKEFLREGISGHTCDRRGNRSYIQESYPGYVIERGFSEEDLLWKPLLSETEVDQDLRSRTVLDGIFSTDPSTWISITSHSGEIGSILRVLNHRVFSLSTGAVIPVLVKAETIPGPAPETTTTPWTSLSTCATQPPLPSTCS